MKSTQYSEKVLDHFRNPRNVGTLEGEGVAIGRVGNPVCGDLMEIYIRVKNDKIDDIKFKTFGCGSAIATASMVSELAKGKTLDEALTITRQDVANELDGLPPIKMHCSNLAADALKNAIENYRSKRKPAVDINAPAECKRITNAEEFVGRGMYLEVDDIGVFNEKRTLVYDRGARSIELALTLTEHAPRVVYVTPDKEEKFDAEQKKKLKAAGVKILYQSEILEIAGADEVEKVRIHNLDEDEEYDLFMDAVVILN